MPGNHEGAPPITAETAHVMHALRLERKRERIAQAANMTALADVRSIVDPVKKRELKKLIKGPDAWIAAVAVGRQGAAMDKDNPYGNAAANWLTENTGLSEKQEQAQPGLSPQVLGEAAAAALIALAERLRSTANSAHNASTTSPRLPDAE